LRATQMLAFHAMAHPARMLVATVSMWPGFAALLM
jgi:hypothetical protein